MVFLSIRLCFFLFSLSVFFLHPSSGFRTAYMAFYGFHEELVFCIADFFDSIRYGVCKQAFILRLAAEREHIGVSLGMG
jgi:hypothetical protein